MLFASFVRASRKPALPLRLGRWTFVVLPALLLSASLSFSAEDQRQRKAVFLPFNVQAPNAPPHLASGLADVLAGRVAAQARISAVTQGRATEQMRQAMEQGDYSAFGRLLAETGADYLILGSVGPGGGGYEVNGYVFSKGGGAPRRVSRSFSDADDPLPAVEELAADVSAAILGRANAAAPATSPFTSANPERAYRREMLAENMPGLGQSGGNFRLVESLRGRPLDMEVQDMGIADVDGDGVREIVLLGKKSIELYTYQDGRFLRKAVQKLPAHLNYLALTLVDANGNGLPELYVGASNGNLAASSVWEWRGGRLECLEQNVPYYLHAVSLDGEAMLLGQQPVLGDPVGGKIHLMRYEGDVLAPSGNTLPIIEGYNVYDVAPVDLDGDGSLEIVAINRQNRLEVFKSGALLWTSADEYGLSRNFYGTPTAVSQAVLNRAMQEKEPVYMHTRIVVTDFDGDGIPEVVVGKNRQTTMLSFLPGVRYFDGSSLAALTWDGHGMRVLWETQQMAGYTIAYEALADPSTRRLELFFAAEENASFLQFWSSPDIMLHRLVLAPADSE